nr:hypothetical protein [Fodinicola feengrottensis]
MAAIEQAGQRMPGLRQLDHRPASGRHDRLARLALADHLGGQLVPVLDPVEEDVLFALEIVENRHPGHAGVLGDLRNGDLVETVPGEQGHPGVGDLLPGLPLAAFPATGLCLHGHTL